MTLKTLTGPSISAALADARRLFGADVVLLQSTPASAGAHASVTVAYDQEPRPIAPARPAPPAVPEPVAQPSRRAYAYGNVRPALAEPLSAPPLAAEAEPGRSPRQPAEPSAPAGEIAALRARLADLEAALEQVRATTPPAAPHRPPLVLVGPSGSGKTTLALRLAGAPEIVKAHCPAVLVVAPESGPFLDPAPSFWDAGVPVAVVRTAGDVVEALRLFPDADRLIVDTPGLPRSPDLARAAVARLGAVLAPLAAVEVVMVVDASRTPEAAAPLSGIGLAPDALALTRLDEAACAPGTWERAYGLPARFASAGTAPHDLTASSAADPSTQRVVPFDPFLLAPASERSAPWEPSAEAALPRFHSLADSHVLA